MNQDDFEIYAQRLAATQEKFLDGLCRMIDVMEGLTDQLKGFREYLQSWGDFLEAHHNTSKALIESHQSVLKAFADSSVEISENTAHVKKLISKVESYFGTEAGLDYDN